MSDLIKISIVIPSKNGAKTIDACLKGILEQTLIAQTEVIVIDSGSIDNTLNIIKKYPVRLVQIPAEEFGHGKTRNLGVSLSKGEFVVMTVQDARPASTNWLEIMIQHFKENDVVGVCGQQAVPHEKDKNPLEWHHPVSKPGYKTVFFPNDKFEKLTLKEQWLNCQWDDVNAMYRKSILEKIPFKDVEFGEDMIWVKEALHAGEKIIFDKNSKVWHYHHYNDASLLKKRVMNTLLFTLETFNYRRNEIFSIGRLIRIVYLCFKYKAKPYWWVYNVRLFFNYKRIFREFNRDIQNLKE